MPADSTLTRISSDRIPDRGVIAISGGLIIVMGRKVRVK